VVEGDRESFQSVAIAGEGDTHFGGGGLLNPGKHGKRKGVLNYPAENGDDPKRGIRSWGEGGRERTWTCHLTRGAGDTGCVSL